MFKKVLFAFLLFSLFMIAFSGCSESSGTDADKYITISENSSINIIYGSNASDNVVKSAKKLGNQIKEITSAEVIVKSDWRFNETVGDNVEESSVITVLFGKTEQELSKTAYEELPQEGYSIRFRNKEIVISATTEKLLSDASDVIINNYSESDGTLKLPRNKEIKNDDIHFFKLADGKEITVDFIIKNNVGKKAECLVNYAAELLSSKSGASVKVFYENEYQDSGKGQIIISQSKMIDQTESLSSTQSASQANDLKANENISSIRYLGNKLYINGSNENSLLSAITTFIGDVILNCDKRENGNCLFYYLKGKTIRYLWDCPLPVIPSCRIDSKSENGIGDYFFEYCSANERVYKTYSEILQKIGFLISNRHCNENEESTHMTNGKTSVDLIFKKDNSIINLNIIST